MVNPFDYFLTWINSLTENIWIAVIVTALLILAITFVVASFVAVLIKKMLTRDSVPIPSMSIYVNLGRIAVWAIGITILAATCFGFDVTGFLAALGIGGIAVSLGFKDTIANLISGVQVSSCKLMMPGDHVEVGNYSGIVIDTTWRHTTIQDMYGETIIVPNAIINSTALVKKEPYSTVRVHVQLHSKSAALSNVSDRIVQEVQMAAQNFGTLTENVKIRFTSIVDGGAKGTVIVKFNEPLDGSTTVDIKDAIIKVMAPYVEAAKQ